MSNQHKVERAPKFLFEDPNIGILSPESVTLGKEGGRMPTLANYKARKERTTGNDLRASGPYKK